MTEFATEESAGRNAKFAALSSKKSNEVEQYADGVKAGEQWSRDVAEYEQLFRVSELRQFDKDDFDGALSALWDAVDPDGYGGSPDIIEDLFGHELDLSDAKAAGFISSARRFFKSLDERF